MPVVDGVSSTVTDEISLDTSVSIVVIIVQVFLCTTLNFGRGGVGHI